MTFQDEQKQKEFEAFAEWYAEIAKRPSTSAHKSTMNQLRDMGSRLYGSAAFQEVLRANRVGKAIRRQVGSAQPVANRTTAEAGERQSKTVSGNGAAKRQVGSRKSCCGG